MSAVRAWPMLWWARLLPILLPLFLVACTPAPDHARLERDVAARLARVLDGDVLELDTLRRLGSAPAPAAGEGADRRIVYFNATLRLARDYAFTDWDALNPKALATLLGATARGIQGIGQDGNQAGDLLRVRGSLVYEARDDDWRPVLAVPPPPTAAPPLDNTGPPAQARRIAEQILARFDAAPADEAQARAIITEELIDAQRQIERRLDRMARAFVVAGGPAGGEYDEVARAIAAFVTTRGTRAAQLVTDGSVENLGLLAQGRADVAIVQNDVAARFVAGQDAAGGVGLRALGSLFPEPLHLVVRADGAIRSLADLAGRRVDLGLPDSGTRPTVRALLAAHGVAPDTLHDPALGGAAAAQALRRGEIDAFAAVIHAPAGFIQALAADTGIRLLPIDAPAPDAQTGLVPVVLPPGTYPGQREPVATLAAAALLAARADLPADEARMLAEGVFGEIDFAALGSGAGAQISARSARAGLSMPLHEALAGPGLEAAPSPAR